MNRKRQFFATKSDLVPGLTAIDQELGLRYRLYSSREQSADEWPSLLTVPYFGTARGESHMSDDIYLAQPARRPWRRALLQLPSLGAVPANGFLVQLGGSCPDGALLIGGVWGPHYATRSCRTRRERFWRLLTQGFERIKIYSVGPEAAALLRSGGRLVPMSVRLPRDHDLRA